MRACVSVTLLTIAASGGWAVEASAQPIVITGTKVDAEIGQVPVSVAVASGQEIADRGDRTLDDRVEEVANVGAINLGMHSTYPVIRGVSGLADTPSALVQTDGIAPLGMGFDGLLDVASLEILRGPQGTLYGRNSLPGVVSVVTNDPGRQWNGNAELTTGSYWTRSLAVAGGGPVADGLGVRLAARGETSDGFRTNISTHDDHAAERRDGQVQGKVVWEVGDGWTARLTGVGAHFRTTGDQYAPLSLARDHQTQNSEPGEFSNRVLASGLTLERRTDALTITSITGGAATRDVFALDIDFSPTPGDTLTKVTDNRQLSEELRASGGKGLRSWVAGVYVARDTQDVDYGQTITPVLNPLLPVDLVTQSRGIQHRDDLALFGEDGIGLGPGWTLTLGLRVDHTRITADLDQETNLFPGFSYTGDRSHTALLPKAALSYAWSDDVLTWLSATRGYQMGGYNLTPNSREEIAGGYDPEFAWSYELGQRIAAFDRALRMSVAGFLMDYRDKQVSVLQPPSTYVIRNAARATIIGVESDNVFRVMPGIDVLAGAGALRATFDEYDAGNGADLGGNHLPMAPSYDAYIGTQWRHESGVIARVDLAAVGSSYAEETNRIDQDSYRQLGARLGYEAEQWGVYVWGRNLLDEVHWTRASISPTAGEVAVSSEPRTFGVTASGRF